MCVCACVNVCFNGVGVCNGCKCVAMCAMCMYTGYGAYSVVEETGEINEGADGVMPKHKSKVTWALITVYSPTIT